jgi:hypothetical protein
MRKFLLLGAALGAAIFTAGNASAVMGTLTISGTVQNQVTTKSDVPAIQNSSFSQKNLLFILEQATGDTSITNKTTKIYFDPDALNTNATSWESFNGVNQNVYGIFYYSNSVSGLTRLDSGYDGTYISYMEFDFYNSVDGELDWAEGFWNPDGMASTSVTSFGNNSLTENGTAILYVHTTGDNIALPGLVNTYTSTFYYANGLLGAPQNDAAVIQGPITFKASINDKTEIETESFTIKGSGDIIYSGTDGIISSGTVTFSGKGPDELFP